jgi:MFS family permease
MDPSTIALSRPPETLFGGGRAAACAGAVLLISLLAFESMAVAAAMPAIAAALDGDGLYALAFGGMMATSVLGMVGGGHLCDRRGPRAATVTGLWIFGAGLLLAGAAGHMALVVAGRIVQGLGSGLLGVALYVAMGRRVPQALHPRLFAAFAAAWVLPALLGPPVAAALVQMAGWRWVFLGVALMVPVAAALLVPALGRDAPPAAPESGAPPPLGWAALAAAGALALHAAGGGLAPVLALPVLAGGAALALRAAGHLLPAGSLVAAPGLPAVIALRGLLAAAFATAEVFVPLYLTREAGWSLAQAGLALTAGAVSWSAGSQLQARLRDPRWRDRALTAGFAAVAAGIAVAALPAALGAPAWLVPLGWAGAGGGIGLAFPMLSVLTLARSAPDDQGRNAAALQLADALCCSAALALAGLVFRHAAGAPAYLGVLGLAAALALAGAALSRRAGLRG